MMLLEFFLLFGCLNLTSLNLKQRQKVLENPSLIHAKAIKIVKYKKNNNDYWDGARLHQQVVNKILYNYCINFFS